MNDYTFCIRIVKKQNKRQQGRQKKKLKGWKDTQWPSKDNQDKIKQISQRLIEKSVNKIHNVMNMYWIVSDNQSIKMIKLTVTLCNGRKYI